MNDYVYFAFIDILGYKNFLSSDINNNTLEFKDNLQAAFNIFVNINTANFHYKSISDSIFIHSSNENPLEFLKLLKKIYVEFLQKGILIRGGVSYNRHFENASITYSLALTEAYNLESEQAIYPRIMIHDSIIKKLENEKANGGNYLTNIINDGLLVQDGNLIQLHIIDNENWNNLYLGCKKIYLQTKETIDNNSSIRAKHNWLQNYLFLFRPKNCRKSQYLSDIKLYS